MHRPHRRTVLQPMESVRGVALLWGERIRRSVVETVHIQYRETEDAVDAVADGLVLAVEQATAGELRAQTLQQAAAQEVAGAAHGVRERLGQGYVRAAIERL
eukprot:ctg_949.g226